MTSKNIFSYDAGVCIFTARENFIGKIFYKMRVNMRSFNFTNTDNIRIFSEYNISELGKRMSLMLLFSPGFEKIIMIFSVNSGTIRKVT